MRGYRYSPLRCDCVAQPQRRGASRLAVAGADLRTVQELLGHQTIEMTLRCSHLSPGHQLEAVERLNAQPTGTTTGTEAETAESENETKAEVAGFPGENWRARQDSNLRPTGSKLYLMVRHLTLFAT